MDKKSILKSSIVGFFIISILGTLLHFVFQFSGYNIFIGIFSAINESVWEHLKIAIVPVILWTLFEFSKYKYRWDNLWTSLFVKIITIMISITFGFYFYKFIFSGHNVVIDILLFYISILFGQITGYFVSIRKKVNINIEEISKLFVIFIFMLFIFFTFFPPKVGLFKDESTNTFGIFKIN
ncbi:MAG: DUF6512 family protein [Clostridia bacterium]